VNSSAVPDARRVAATPEEETEDEALDESNAPATTPKRNSRPRATPQLPHQLSLVVQETPTAARVNSASTSMATNIDPPDFAHDTTGPVKEMPLVSREQEADFEQVSETFSTARTGESQDKLLVAQNADVPLSEMSATGLPTSKDGPLLRTTKKSSPLVQIPPRSARKRTTSAVREISEPEHEAHAGGVKRTKPSTDDDSHDSQLSNIDAMSQKSSKKAKKRYTSTHGADALDEGEQDALTRSPQSTQELTCATAEAYDGPPPKVASSNSTITKSSQAVKLLKKQGGAYVEKLTDDFNILW
jgi:hypothetical protein